MSSIPLIYYLADLASSFVASTVPSHIRLQAILCILDTVGCTIAGSIADEPNTMLRSEIAIVGGSDVGSSTVVGSDVRLPLTSAARVNAFMGDQFELNDLLLVAFRVLQSFITWKRLPTD